MNVFDLVAKITLDQSEYDEGLKSAGSNMEGFGSKLKAGLGKAAKIGAATIAAVGTASAALTKTILDGASKTAAYGDNIDKMSQKLGISAQAYQEWDAILQHSGSSIDSMQRGMMTLSNAAVKGSEAFEKLGISQEDVASMSQEDLFASVIKGLQGMEEGAERTALAQELLGGAAKELGPLLNTSAEDTEKMRKRVNELGGVMSNKAVKAAAAYQDSLQDMTTAFSGLKNNLFFQFMPSITTVMDGLTEIFSGNGDKGIGIISDGINNLVTVISEKIPQFLSLGVNIVQSIGKAIINNLPTILKSASQIIGQLVAGLISALPELIKMAPDIVVSIVQGLVAAWPEIKKAGADLLKMLWDGISAASSWLIEKVKGLFDFEWKLPDLKLPHIVVGSYITVPVLGTIPDPTTLHVEWYRKAYDQPYVFSKPTVVQGFGDGNGDEMVYGKDNLMKDIRSAAGGSTSVTINVNGANIDDPQTLAEKISYELSMLMERQEAAHA